MRKNTIKKLKLKAAALLIVFFSSFLSAETRIKTVEYNFGGYYNATNLASATQYNFPVRNIKLPENGKTIRSAWLEYEGFTAAATNINPLVIYFDAASTPSTARFTSGQYTAQTGESIVLFARADVTAAIQAQINNLASGVNFSAGIRITGPATNPHTMKLFITYEYDDESPLQVKTVKFPLYSDYTNKIASFLTQQAAATRSMQYLADISETNSFKIQQQWFEIKGHRQDPGSTTDGTIYLNIGGGTNEPTMYLDSGLRDSYYFRYLSSSTVTPGFSTGTVQTVNIVYTLNAINTLGGEVVITYEFSPASPVKTETASLFWGTYLSSGVASSYYFGRPLVLKEEGITIKEIYQKIYGSYDTTTSGNITLQSKIDSTAGTSRSYAQIVTQAQISGYEFIHSLNDIKNSWNNGSVIGSTITVPAGAGSHSAELVVTYSYSNGAAHTSNYSVYAGNPAVYNTHPYSYTSDLYWVEAGSSKTLNSAYILSNHISNSATQDYSVTLSFNGNSPSSAFNKTTVESTLTKRLYENNSQVAIGTTSVTTNYSSSLSLGPFGGHIGINYGYVPPPKNPYSLNQKLPSGTAIGLGQWINSSQVRFESILSSSMSADTLSLVVEVKPNSSSFDGTNLSTGPSFSYSGTPLSAYTIVSGLLSGTVYKWRAAGLGLGNLGNWIYFTAPSFAVDLSSPPAPSMVSINPQNSSSINYQNTALDFEDVTDIDGSGVKNYEIQLATSSDFTTVVFSSMPLASYAYVSSLIEKPYFWRVRVYDNAGNIGSWSSSRNFTVDLTTPSITDNQADDTIWRNSNSGIYNVDFSDSGNSLLSKFQVKAASGPNQSGTLIADWTDVITGINSNSYTADWSLPISFWNLLKQDYQNYISVRVYDNAGNSAVLNDVFTVLKDTTSPQINDSQSGDDIWRNSNNGSYNLSFSDLGGSLIKNIEVKITTGPNQSGTLIYDWNNLISAVNASSYPGPITIPPGIWNILPDATSYLSFRVYDYAGSTSTLIDTFYIRKDTQNPSAILSVPASTNSLSLTVSASYQDYGYSGVDNLKLYYTYNSASPYTWLYYGAFSSPSISFLSSQSGFVGFGAVIYDKAGNRDENDPPSSLTAPEVFTDIALTVPIITDNQNGDETWRSSGGTLYDVDFSTGGGSSPLMAAQYKVTSQPNQGGSIFKDWTYIASNINYHEYKTNWPVDFNSLDGGINYVSVRVWNTAGTTVTLNDVFYIKKDTVVPSLIDNQTGDYNWKNLDSGTYDIDAADSDSLLNRISIKITTGPGQSGTLISDWETAVGNINLDSYTQNWQIPSNIWSLVPAGTSYVSVRAWDNSGLYSQINDAFFVLKDTVNPTALDNQSGDDVWRGAVSGNYDIDAFDYGNSLLKSLEIKIMSLPGQSGTQILDWYSLIYMAPWNISSYTDNFSLSSIWDLIPEGTSYVSVKIKDKAENYSVLPDAFYIRKDISGPLINDNQSGDDIWRKDNSAQYSVFFQDNLSGLKGFEVKASSGLNQSGTLYSDWTKVSDLSGNSFNSNWSLPLSVWNSIKEGTAYISVRTSDTVGNISISTDVFYVKKDTTAPSIIDNQNGDYVWRNLNNGTYNISFNDNSSLLDKVQIKITSAPYQSGTLYCDWTDAFTNINSASYSSFWSLPQTLWDLISGPTAYVSLRVLDKAGNVNSLTDAFFILKDTAVPYQITNLSANTSANEGEIALSFTAPYDNGELGGYEVRYATYPINASNFDSASEFVQSWIPVSQQETESRGITGLDGGTLYYIAVKTYDKAGNLSQISNIVSANSGPDQTAPAVINDLNASQGAYEGEVMLSWTSVGDNGLYIGTATAYQVRYRSDVAITNLTLWNSANVYSQNLSPQGPGNTENLTISGLNAGVTYYFSVRAVDEVSNIGNLSNSASAWAQISQGRNGVFVYQSGTNNTPFYKDWIPPNFSSQNTTLATNATPSSNIRHIIVKASPLRKEKMAGILSSDGVLQIQRYDQISGIWTNEWSTTTISAANSAYRGFDIAYEQNSGRCLILYNGTTAGTLHYKIYDGNSWSPTYTLTAGTAYASLWLRLEPRPDSNEILAAFSKATSLEIYAVIWNGSDWVNGQQIRNGVGLTTKQDWDIAWESLSGKALVTYNNNTAGRADTYQWNGSVWSQVTSSYFSFQGGTGIAQWIRLASDPNSNYIGATSVDSLADWNASVWDGSSWSYQATENRNVRNNTNQARTIDAIWEGKSSRLMVMSGQGGITNNVIFATFSVTGGWGRTLSAAQTFGTWSNRVYGFQLENDKDTDALILIGYSAGSDLRSAVWNGTAWTFNPSGTHSTTLSQYAYMPAMIATDRHDVIPPTLIDNQNGDDIWRNENIGIYNIDAQDSGGSGLRGIQTKIYSGSSQSGEMIEDWTYQVSTSGVNNYFDNWSFLVSSWDKMKEGVNYISLRSVDGSSNTSVELIDGFYVKKDTTAPSSPVLSLPVNNSYLGNNSVFFDWQDSQDFASGVSSYEFYVSTELSFSSTYYSNIYSVSQANVFLSSGQYYWKVRAKDNANLYSSYSSVYSVFVDTVSPQITDNQNGDDIWRSSGGTLYDADFSDNNLLQAVQYAAFSGENLSGQEIIPWTDIIAQPVNLNAYTDNFQVNFNLLNSGTNYISLRAVDKAGNSAIVNDAFYVRKDTVSPSIIDNQTGDDIWRNSTGAVYGVFFQDNVSMLDKVRIKITSGPAGSGMLYVNWTDFISNINSPSYLSPWPLSQTLWDLIAEGTSYVSLQVYDKAGNINSAADLFYILKDTTPPSSPSLTYPSDSSYAQSENVFFDWSDSSDLTSGVLGYEVIVSTDIGFDSSVYSYFSTISQSTSSALSEGHYYWKVRANDKAGNYSPYSSAYSVFVDTVSPQIIDNQNGDDTWRNLNNGLYNVSFTDGNMLDKVQVKIMGAPSYGGMLISDWSDVITGINSPSYSSPWQITSTLWNLLPDGTSYVSIRAYDKGGNFSTLADAFYIRKDISGPQIIDNQPGDNTARTSNDGLYDIDFYDAYSQLNKFQIKITTLPNYGGSLVADWTDTVTGINSSSYISNWSLPSSVWTVMPNGYNYVSVRVYDNLGNYSETKDVFYVIKGPSSLEIIDNQSGDDTWRYSNNGVYDVDFNSLSANLNRFEIRVGTLPAYYNSFITDWTQVLSGIDSLTYTMDWALPSSVFDSMISGVTNYVSVRVYDDTNASQRLDDVFYVKKDTVAPYAPSLYSPSNGGAYNSLNIPFDWLDSSDIGSAINSYDIEISTDINFAVFSSSGNFTLSNANLTVSKEGIYYWRVKAKDNVGLYSSWSSTYSVIIDTTSPQINDGQTGDDIWRSINNWTYNISLSDIGGSLLDKLRVKITTAPSFGGILISDWTDLYANINAASFGGPISINSSLWDLMREGTNYVSLSVYDKAGNSYQIEDAFYIRKDTTVPTIINNQSGDDIWRSLDPGAAYDTDFSDYSSAISSASYIVYSQTSQSGDLIKGETQIFNYPLGSYSHIANWGVDFSFLREGLNYVSVKAYDRAGNVSVLNDVFYVKKDTSAPVIYDSQNGDDIWRNINIATYAVSFADYGIGISTLAISAYTLPSSAGQQLINYATFYFGSPIPSYSSGWSLTNQMWDLLKQGTNYIKIHAVDGLGNETQVQDVFYVRKDTTSPSSLTLSAFTPSSALDEGKVLLTWTAVGDDALLGAASYYTIRYSPSEILEGNFNSASVFVSTLTPKNSGQSESVFIDGLIASVTYYAAIKAVDKAGNISLISNSPFAYAGLDKTPPSAISDLSASEGDFTGQIKLDWTAVGEGTAGLEGNLAAYSYLVKYTSSVWSGFDSVNVSTYTQTWLPLSKGETETRVIEGLLPGSTYTIAVKVIDEAGNISPISNVVIGTAAPAGAADGLIIYPQSGTSDLKYRTWSPIVWSSQLDTSLNSAASARWIVIKAVPTFANAKIAGVLYSDNSLKIYKYDGLSALWSDITPIPAPVPAASNYRKFDIAVENNSGRIMVAYYNNSAGSISYAIYSATSSAWVVGPSSLSLASLTGTINWVKLKSLPGSNKIALAVLDSNSDISAAIWNANAWGNNVNLTAAASLATKEVFDISWETLSGDLLAMWGTGTTTNYRKYYSTSTWAASALTGPNPAAAVQWLRLSSDPLSNRIGASYLYGTTSWNAAIWRAAATETWTASTADTTISQVAARITDCAWQSKTSKFIAVAADEIGTIDNKFKTAVWSGGTWSATPSAGTVNNYTVFAGSINWLSLYPDPNTDNITLLGIDTAFDLKSTVWSGSAWADLSSSANFLHQNNLPDFNYEAASADFDRHDTIPPTAIDNQTGDDVWRNSNSAFYNINATDSGGSKLAGIQTKIRTAPYGGGTLIEDWTYQVSAINSDSYSSSWPFIDDTFNKIPQGQSYVWVRAVDGVGNISNEISDAFYVRKDTTPPQIINNMPSDYFSSWTSTGTGPVNIDFSDSGGSQISSAAWSAYSQSSMGGSLIVQNVLIASGTMGNSYNTGWSPDFSLMAPGTNYISVTVWDNAGSSQTLIDAFKILKDTIAPSAASDFSAQPGPLSGSILITWTAPGDDGNYNNNFQGGYIIKYATYPIVTQSLFDSASSYLSSPIPASAGAQQSAVIYELENETTYYFALKTYDKAYNISSLSPSVSSLPGRNGIFINEIYAAGNSSSDWIEFFNNTNLPISLDGWKIIYKQGALDSAAAEVQIWAGGASDIVSSSSIYKINPNYDLNSAQSYSLILKNQQNYVIDKVQWPSMGIGESFARVYDGYEFFEIDPTPTPGYKNSISTSDIKINEISYSGYEFIEIYNLGNSTLTLTDYYLRNSNAAPFRFDRKIYPGSYSGIDDTSFSKDNFDYYSSFGLNGLKENGDFLVLEDSSGQTLDRLVWQSAANYSFYDYKAVKVSAKNYAAANSLALARLNGEGYDSDLDSYDFSVPASATPFSRNSGAGQSSANTLIFPQDNSVLPANFPIKLSFGEDYSAGANDIIVFIRTSGAQDYQSPHIFRLSDIGFNLSSLSPQTSAYLSSYFSDIDGNKLSDKAYYKVILVSDKNSYSSPQIVKQNIYADFASHPYLSFKSSAAYLNENSKQSVFSFVLRNSASAYDLTLSSAIFYLYDKNSVPLTQTQAENLIKSAAIYSDSSLGEKGKYESEIDSDLAAEKQNYELSVDASGKVIIEISSSAAVSSLSLGSSSTYYLVFNSTDNASIQNPKEILVKLSQILIRDKNNFLFQPLSGFSPLISSTFTFIRPASPPAGTNWPYSAPSPLLVETMADIYNGGLLTNRVYISGKDGIIRTVDYNGNEKWTFANSPVAEIKTAPLIREEGSFVYLYFADSLGNIYKLKDNGASGSQEWKINLSNAVSGNLIDTQDKIYTATSDGKIHCINKIDGNTCSGWTYDLGFNGSINGTLSIDDRPEINTGWIGLENGKVIAFRLSDGLILNQFTTGGPVYASPFVDSAYAYANNNLYIASADGKLYSRNSANLTAVPPYWNDFNAGSPIYSSPFKGIGEDYVYIGDDSGKLYKVSSTSGTLTGGWVYQAPEKIRTIPVALPEPHNKVFFSSGEFLYCLNTADASLCSGYPIHTGGEIKGDIIIDFDNSVLVFSSSGGKTYMIEI